MDRSVPFVDVPALMRVHGPALEEALARVIRSGQFINGPEVAELERQMSERVGVTHAVACGSGTDAETLLLMALGIGPGDEVIVPDFTFIATAEAVARMGASPVCVDVDPRTFNLDPAAVRAAMGPKVKAMIPVGLYGQPADFDQLDEISQEFGIHSIEDACQSLGSTLNGRASGSFGVASFTSFYPSKPLGGIGDGGMVFTDDERIALHSRRTREHGQVGRHVHQHIGMNSRLDSLQAAALLVKLRTFDQEVELRSAAAARYDEALGEFMETPHIMDGAHSSRAQYTVRLETGAQRDGLMAHLNTLGVPTALHYPQPIHTQEAVRPSIQRYVETPVATMLCETVVSLPLSSYISREDQDRVIAGVLEWVALGNAAAAGS